MARSSDAVFPLSLVRDKTFQLRQVRRVLLLAAFFIVQSTLLLGVFWHNLLGEVVAGNAPLMFASEDMSGLAERVPSTSAVMGRWLVAMLAVNAVLTGGLCVWILRRLGSPVLAIRRALNEIGDGNLEVRLRTGDTREFSELTVALNRALEEVQGRIAKARQLTRVLEGLDDQPLPEPDAVREALAECGDVLAWFDRHAADDAANGGDDTGRGTSAANSDAGGIRRDRRSDRTASRHGARTGTRDGARIDGADVGGPDIDDDGDRKNGGKSGRESDGGRRGDVSGR